MTRYEKNREILRRVYGLPADVVPDTLSAEFELRSTAEGSPTLAWGGTLIHSARAPRAEAARLVRAALSEPANSSREAPDGSMPGGKLPGGDMPGSGRIIILLGLGLGYAALEAAAQAPNAAFIVVEKSPQLMRAALEVHDWADFFTRHNVMLLLDAPAQALFSAMNAAEALLPPGVLAQPLVVGNRALREHDAAYYRAVEHNIAVWRSKSAVNAATWARFGKRWQRNLEANRPALAALPGVRELFGSSAGKPVLLLAAGPSLDDIAPHSAALWRRYVIVAVDTALRFCARAGLEPDFALSVDGQYWNARHLDQCARFGHTRFIFDLAVYPAALRRLRAAAPGRVYLCASNVPGAAALESEYGKKGKLAAGGSVATSAWDFCRLLGACEIWIAGLDLAFPHLKTHYKGAFFEERALAGANRFAPAASAAFNALHALPLSAAPAQQGGQVLTDARLRLYATWFTDALSRYSALPVYSLAQSGLAIPGIQPACLEQALKKPAMRKSLVTSIDF